MSEEIIPEVNVEANVPSDVPEPAEMAPVVEAAAVNYQEMGIPELVAAFEQLAKSEDRMQRAKEADAIKSAFYKKLIKAKSEAGIDPESAEENPFTGIEEAFKAYYNAFKKEKAEYNKAQEAERERNLALKQAVIEDLKQLLEKQEDVKVTFPEFRSIQDRWKAVGPVPVQNFRNLNETYQLYVEQFYDMVNINRELRDLDFKKNLEAKTAFCEEAEALAQRSDVVEAFRELQKLHEQWKDYGPVEKQYRESIWERFKAATAVINRNYQAHFEGLKEQQEANLVAKTALCEKAEAIAAAEMANANEWNAATKAARKLAICEQAEALKDSTDWKATADTLIDLQKQWKEIGAVPRQKSDALWKRFRAACDSFFEARDKQPKDANDYYGNLKAKQRLIAEINAYELSGDAEADAEAGSKFSESWQAIGFVPFKEKDRIAQAYREAMAKFNAGRGASRRQRPERTPMTEKERLVKKYNQLEQDIVTYENNLGFFARSKNAEPLIRQMEERIAKVKEELRSLEAEIRSME